MSSYIVQFQRGLSLPEFLSRYGTEAQCIDELQRQRWPGGFSCPHCSEREPYRVSHGRRTVLQGRGCGRQTSLMAGTVLDSSKLPLRTWFLAMFLICQAKTGLSALALRRQLGVSYRTAWLLLHKVMAIMAAADAKMPLRGSVVVDDAYLGGERRGPGGLGSPNKVPFLAAVELNAQAMPMFAKLVPVPGFTVRAIADWARGAMLPGTEVLSDGLACFSGVIDASCANTSIVVGQRKPREMPRLKWENTLLGNLNWHIPMRPDKRCMLEPTKPIEALTEELERVKTGIRARVKHPFRMLKRHFAHIKVRDRGLVKKTAQLHTLFPLANLRMAPRVSIAQATREDVTRA